MNQKIRDECVGHSIPRCEWCYQCIADEFNKQCKHYEPLVPIRKQLIIPISCELPKEERFY